MKAKKTKKKESQNILMLILAFLILSISFLTPSCTMSNEGKMKANIKDYLFKNIDDPSGFEFVEFRITDQVTYLEAVDEAIEYYSKNGNADSLNKKIVEKERIIRSTYDSNYITEYHYYYSYRIKSKSGLKLHKCTGSLDPACQVLSLYWIE